MNGVILVYQKGKLCAALESLDPANPNALTPNELLRCWCASNGLSETAWLNFTCDFAPVITTSQLAKFSEKKPVICDSCDLADNGGFTACTEPATHRLWCPTWKQEGSKEGPLNMCLKHARNFMPQFNPHSARGTFYWGTDADREYANSKE